MQIIKRNGKSVDFNPSKIQKRITEQTKGLKVDADKVSIKVIGGVADNMTTSQLDELAAETAATMATNHPDYSMLASRLTITSLHKETAETFTASTYFLLRDTNLLAEEYTDRVEYNGVELDEMIDHSRDFLFDYFGLRTLMKSYLLRVNGKIVERPQYLYMRVAITLWGDNLEEVKKTYDLLSLHYFTHATPTLFNAGLKDGQFASCFLIANKGDDKIGIMDTAKDVAVISAASGGIGLHVHDVRAAGSPIAGSGGTSNGLLPLLKTYNELSKWWDQCFVPDTQVLTSNGYKNIGELNQNSQVLTSDGKYNKVLNNKAFEYSGEMVKLVVGEKEVTVTFNHPFLVIQDCGNFTKAEILDKYQKGILKMVWVDAKDVKPNDCIVKYEQLQ